MIQIKRTSDGASFSVRVVPRASRNGIAGLHGDAIRIRLTAPPVDGAANEALTKYLAGLLDVARRDIEITSGHSSRTKVIAVYGISPQELRAKLLPHLSES